MSEQRNMSTPEGTVAYMIKQRREAKRQEQRALSVDGKLWYEAKLPRRWHCCYAHTSGSTTNLRKVERCACGAIRLDGSVWIAKNSRRKESRVRV